MEVGSAAGMFVSVNACGGKVVLDSGSSSGEGGGGAATSGTTVSSSSGSVAYECDVVAPPEYTDVYGCLAVGPLGECPAKETDEVKQGMSKVLNWSECDQSCCTEGAVAEVVCGPDPTAVACCYTTLMTTATSCEGDP
jgi:hypothetical protein